MHRSITAQFLRASLGASVLALAAAGATTAHAQQAGGNATGGEAAAASSGDAGDIVVTARRREESLQDVPLSISALNAEGLQRANIRQSSDLQQVTPGLVFTQGSDSRQNSAFNIRGAGQAFGGNLPSVLTYFADVPLDYHGAASFAIYDLANVQVARGPQGTLFGRNTTAGAVLFVPQAPTDTLEGFVTGEGGNYNLAHFQGALNLPITDTLQVRLSGDILRRGGTALNVTTGHTLDGRHQDSGRIYVRWQPTDAVRNDLIFQILEADETGVSYILKDVRPDGNTAATLSSMDRALWDLFRGPTGTAQYLARQAARGPRKTELNFDPVESRTLKVLTNTTSVDLTDNVTLKNIFGYERVKTNYTTDIDGTPQDVNFTNGNVGIPEYSTRQISNELQLSVQTDRFNGIAGFFVLDSKTPENSRVFQNGRISLSNFTFVGDNVPPPGVYSLSRNSQSIHDTSRALFAQGSFKLADTLTVTGGFRYTWDTRASTTGQMSATALGGPFVCRATLPNGSALPLNTPEQQCLTTIKGNFNGYGYTGGIDWKPTDNTLAYFTTRRNFKDGGQNFVNTLNASILNYQPEIATDYEVGLKQKFQSGDLRGHANIALFWDKYDNMQRQVTLNTGFAVSTVIFNAAKATIKGIEFEGSVSFANFTFTPFYNFTDAAYDNFIDPGTGVDLSNTKLVGTPRHSGGASLTYRADLGDLGSLEPSVSFYKTSKYAFSASQVVNGAASFTKPYTLLNARVDWRNAAGLPMDFAVFVSNLTNKDYYVAGLALYASVLGYNSVVYGQPRTYGVQLTYRFGSK